MNVSNKPLACAEANRIGMVDYLFRLCFQPTRISGHHYWYLSPFRKERTDSFKVNTKMNCWYDFGEGSGGTLVDFGIRYFRCSVSEFLQRLSLNHSSLKKAMRGEEKEAGNSKEIIRINKAFTLSSPNLLAYLKGRKIEMDVARKWCKEVSFIMYDKTYSAIGFMNNSGGYELRNSFFKGSSRPKDITTWQNGANRLAIFEGFFDFLSYLTVCKDRRDTSHNFMILNSLSFVYKIEPLLSSDKEVNLFLDRDKSGQKATTYLLSLGSHLSDKSELYRNHKDFNEWLVNFGLRSKDNPPFTMSDFGDLSK